MSIDLVIDGSTRRQRAFQRVRVRRALRGAASTAATHIVVVFGGWGGAHGGEPLDASGGESSDTAALVRRIQQIRPVGGGGVSVHAYHGAMTQSTRADRELLPIIASQFHPLGKLILYGYSAGGFMAMRLAYRLGVAFPYYSVRARRFARYPTRRSDAQASVGQNVWGFARVDLMVTVDAAVGPASGVTNRRVWPSVRKNLNIYQTVSGTGGSAGVRFGVGSHGGFNVAVDDIATQVVNNDWTERYRDDPGLGHSMIDRDSADVALQAIRDELDR